MNIWAHLLDKAQISPDKDKFGHIYMTIQDIKVSATYQGGGLSVHYSKKKCFHTTAKFMGTSSYPTLDDDGQVIVKAPPESYLFILGTATFRLFIEPKRVRTRFFGNYTEDDLIHDLTIIKLLTTP